MGGGHTLVEEGCAHTGKEGRARTGSKEGHALVKGVGHALVERGAERGEHTLVEGAAGGGHALVL